MWQEWERWKIRAKFWSENLYGRDCLGDRNIDMRIVRQLERDSTGWVHMASDEVLWCAVENVWVPKEVVLDLPSCCQLLNKAVLYAKGLWPLTVSCLRECWSSSRLLTALTLAFRLLPRCIWGLCSFGILVLVCSWLPAFLDSLLVPFLPCSLEFASGYCFIGKSSPHLPTLYC